MHTKVVNLYDHYSLPAPRDALGRLNCYWTDTPAQVSENRRKPAVLVLPGGGYNHLSHREHEPVALKMLAWGFQVFVLEYSVLPLRFPVALQEAAMAMRYIRENQAAYGLSDKVAAMGFSAGGHLCGTLGTMYDSAEVAHIAPASVIRPDALGLCYPVAVSHGRTHEGSFLCLCGEDRSLWQRLSLDALVRADMPPVFLWHTRGDETVPCRNSILLAAALEEHGVDFSLRIYRQGSHGLATADFLSYTPETQPQVSPDVPGWLNSMVLFFREKGLWLED